MDFNTITGLGGVVAVYVLLRALLQYTQDVREPLPILNSIPFIGPIISMMAYKANFNIRMRDIYDLPIYTLRLPGSRVYVINSTNLIPIVQRHFRTLAFTPIEAKAAADIMGASKTANKILAQKMTDDNGYLMSFAKAIHPAVSPGDGLDTMNRESIQVIFKSLQNLKAKGSSSVKMFEWVRHEISLATTDGVYGPQNPFKDPAVEAAWYKFEPGIMIFILKLMPTVLAKESYQAREFIAKAFERYFQSGDFNGGSALVKARYEHNTEHGIPAGDIARFEIGGAFATLANTSPTAFWVIYHIYSDPAVLDDCRREVSDAAHDSHGDSRIDIADVKESCPTLLSTLQEVLRFHSVGVSTRVVLEDHILDGRYLLKKGNTLMIPGAVQHSQSTVWGPNVGDFNHRRFIRSGGSKRPNPVAFRGFGGGTILCPGRHFASTEILAFAALLILQFDVQPVSGRWNRPTTDKAAMWTTAPAPDVDIEVKLHPRDDRKWNVSFSGSNKAMGIAAEDLTADEK